MVELPNGKAMVIQMTPTQAVLDMACRSQGCNLEEIIRDCPELTWNQVFLAIDRLSREGKVTLNLRQPGHYLVKPGIRHS